MYYIYIRLVTNDYLFYTYQMINAVVIVLPGHLSKTHFRLFVFSLYWVRSLKAITRPHFIHKRNPVTILTPG